MPHFYHPEPYSTGQNIALPESLVRHIHVLRLRVGETITLFDGHGHSAHATLTDIQRRSITAHIQSIAPTQAPPSLPIILLQGISAAEKMDWVIQKSTELGVSHIVPFVAERSVRLEGDRAAKKTERWRDIAIAACEQSQRHHLPTITPTTHLQVALSELPETDTLRLMFSPHHAGKLTDHTAPSRLVLLIGPEGGLSPKETELAEQHGFTPILLGQRILRTETAALAALAAAQTLWGDF